MEMLIRDGQTMKCGKLALFTQLFLAAGLLVAGPAALRALAPAVLTALEILLGIGQAVLTFLRANGF